MTEDDIAKMFIRAAETEAKLPEVKGMRVSYGRYVLPWVHELIDIGDRRRTCDPRTEQLRDKDDPLNEWRWKWLNEDEKRANSRQVSDWYGCLQITSEFLTDVGQRRALWAWALSQAGNLWVNRPQRSPKRISFARWCRDVERVAEITGHRRKNRALIAIATAYRGKDDLHNETRQIRVLPDAAEKGHLAVNIEGGVTVFDTTRSYKASTWADDPAFRLPAISIAEMRALRRRQQEAAKRKQKAA